MRRRTCCHCSWLRRLNRVSKAGAMEPGLFSDNPNPDSPAELTLQERTLTVDQASRIRERSRLTLSAAPARKSCKWWRSQGTSR